MLYWSTRVWSGGPCLRLFLMVSCLVVPDLLLIGLSLFFLYLHYMSGLFNICTVYVRRCLPCTNMQSPACIHAEIYWILMGYCTYSKYLGGIAWRCIQEIFENHPMSVMLHYGGSWNAYTPKRNEIDLLGFPIIGRPIVLYTEHDKKHFTFILSYFYFRAVAKQGQYIIYGTFVK